MENKESIFNNKNDTYFLNKIFYKINKNKLEKNNDTNE